MPGKDPNVHPTKESTRSHEAASGVQAPPLLTDTELPLADSVRTAMADPGRLARKNIVALQKSVGNRAVFGMLEKTNPNAHGASDNLSSHSISLHANELANDIKPGGAAPAKLVQRVPAPAAAWVETLVKSFNKEHKEKKKKKQ